MAKLPPRARRMTPDRTGRMAGEYRLGRKLGEGGFGSVYEAEHPLLKRRAAVKVLHHEADRDSDAVQRFIAEAQAVNQIRSPHIIDIFSFGQLDDGRHFYVMDLLEGEPLDRFLARAGHIEAGVALQLLRPIVEALDAAHAASIVHRDLKPQNIFLTWDAEGFVQPKLLDFGMAKLLAEGGVHTISGTPVGTPLYMSPEQVTGKKVDARSDVYALGVLVHELLTGQWPILGDTTISVLIAHLGTQPPSVSSVRSELPQALDGPVLDMLEKDPALRPASAGEALRRLTKAAESAGITVAPGLPKLPRPPDAPLSSRPGELSGTLAAPSPSGGGPDAMATRRTGFSRTSAAFVGLSLLLGLSVGGYMLSRSRAPEPTEAEVPHPDSASVGEYGASQAASHAAAAPPGAPPVAPRPVGVVQDASRNLADEDRAQAESDAGRHAPKPKKGGAPSREKSPIPKDLENPF